MLERLTVTLTKSCGPAGPGALGGQWSEGRDPVAVLAAHGALLGAGPLSLPAGPEATFPAWPVLQMRNDACVFGCFVFFLFLCCPFFLRVFTNTRREARGQAPSQSFALPEGRPH